MVSEGASFRTHGAVDTSKADVSLENSVWTIIADITTTNQNTLLNLANLAMSDANVIMMDEPVTRSSVTASAGKFHYVDHQYPVGKRQFLYAYRYG
ncbi:outer membrane autotransporter [Escherichia coli]|uniref:Outer membrane autotransporter n=1 Tax=Escherichia coli TaxID=562 RepID=A0A2X1MV09_ECOLX|nr:outer membrane autotransporter [Escherichia coli]